MNSNQIIETLNNNDYNADESGWYVFVTRPFGDERQITKTDIVNLFNGQINESQVTVSDDGLRIRV